MISGTVVDHDDRLPLPNARVGVYRIMPGDSVWTLVKGGLTGPDGAYRFEVAPATYRVIVSAQSYSVVVRDDVAAISGGTTDVSVSLTPKPIQVQGVEVKGTEMRGSEATSLSKQKQSEYVTDAITSEQISKSTDSNAAEALQRVTGLTVVDGRYVYVRGMGERYSSTQVNGANVGTPEPNKRVVPLDIFPTGVLDDIVVQKTYTPDQNAEFGGGVIDVHTRDFVEGTSFSQALSIGYTSGVAEQGFLTYPGGKYDRLGFGLAARDYPDYFKSLAGDQRVATKGVFGGEGFTREEVEALGESFNKTWSPEGESGSPNYSYAGSYMTGFRFLGKESGFMAALSLSNSFSTLTRQNNAYSGTSTRLSPLYEYEVDESNASVLGGGLANLSMRLGGPHSIRLRGLYTKSTDDYARVMEGPNYNFGADVVRVSSLDYFERTLLQGVLSGDHGLEQLGGFSVNWLLSYSEATNDEPDRRETVYESDGLGNIVLSKRTALPLTRIWGDMTEYDRSAAFNVTKPITVRKARDGNVKIGGAYRYRDRSSSYRRLGFRLGTLGRNELDSSLPPESLLIDENIKPGYFELQEGTLENDTYTADQEVYAWYAMFMVPVLTKLDLLAGVRIETSDQTVESESPFVTSGGSTEIQLEDNDALPSINMTYRVNDRMNVRGGYSSTLSRPELREMSPFSMYNYETGYTEMGDTLIRSSPIDNYDLRWEFFPGPRELLSASLFAKTLESPIENVVLGSTGGYILQPRNGIDGQLYGFEIETRIGVRSIWDAAASVVPLRRSSSKLDRWAINFNYSWVESSVKVQTSTNADGSPIYREGPLQGQSSYALNAGLFYGTSNLQGSLMYNDFGPRLAQVGAGSYPSSLPDIYEYPPTSLDFTLSKRLGKDFAVKLSGENLLDSETTYTQLGLVTRQYSGGRTFTLALKISG